MAKLVFEESQRFTQWWLITILVVVLFIIGRSVAHAWNTENFDESGLTVLLFTIIPLIAIVILFVYTSLNSRIDETGIQAVFRPFNFSKNHFNWSDVKSIEVVKYSPLRDYGGWGYRFSGKGKAMNVKGNMGIQLILKSDKQFLIGTQRPEEAKEAIKTYFQH
jgi:hypothetical protein